MDSTGHSKQSPALLESRRIRMEPTLSALDKMWISFIAIGLMVIASLIISFARVKTKGIVRVIISIIAFVLLFFAVIAGCVSIV